MPYLACFVYEKDIDFDPSLFAWNNIEIAGIAMQLGEHPKNFYSSFADRVTLSDGSKRKDLYQNVPAADNWRLHEGSKNPVRTSEKAFTLLKT